MDSNQLPGPLKVAILTKALGPETSQLLMGSLSPQEQERVNGHMAQLGAVSPDLVERVAREFTEKSKRLQASKSTGTAGPASSDRNASKAEKSRRGQGLDSILSLPSDQLFKLIKDEHPQIMAVILVHVKIATASEIIGMLSDEVKTDVAMRIAQLDKVNSGMIEEINQVLEDILKNKDTSQTHETGGVDRLAEILNQADEVSGELIMGEIEENDPELAAKIKQKMFVFEDIVLVDDKGFQKLLRKVETSELAIALKAASEAVREKVFRNLSTRAGEMLKEEIADMGPVRMNDVSAAQQKITGIIQDMEFKGELVISGRRGETLIA
ncbi:MAG: flagellar motor switch protein FliG [Desulfobacterales bacterium]